MIFYRIFFESNLFYFRIKVKYGIKESIEWKLKYIGEFRKGLELVFSKDIGCIRENCIINR